MSKVPQKTSRELLFSVTLADCDVQTFTVGGNGGSGKDTSNTGVRIIHRASGSVGEGREERSQMANKRAAFIRMAQHPKFKAWHRLECAKRRGQKSIEQLVEEDMDPSKIKIEVRVDGVWTLDE